MVKLDFKNQFSEISREVTRSDERMRPAIADPGCDQPDPDPTQNTDPDSIQKADPDST